MQAPPPGRGDLQVQSFPERPFIERRGRQQMVNFDLLVRNDSQETYKLVALRVSIFDQGGKLALKRELNDNGKPAAIHVVGERLLPPSGVIDLLQPFCAFGPEVPLGRMHFELLFMREGHASPPVPLTADELLAIDVAPRPYAPEAYVLPLHGAVLVHDGHDFYSHHRRYDLTTRYKADPRSAVNANLYAYDLMTTDVEGTLFQGEASQKEHWRSYGAQIFAPAEGVVLEAVNDIPDNTFAGDGARMPEGVEARDPIGLGNHVTIRHADGRVSWLLHMQPGSVLVQSGQQVKAGQVLGRVGFSGDALFPHLHYNVTDGGGYPSQGVPSYFKDFDEILGSGRAHIAVGQVDTGDLVASTSSSR